MSKDLLKDLKDEEVSNNRIDEDLKENSVINIVKEFIPYVIILVAVIIIRTYFVTPVLVNGDSMNDTLTNGELMILNKRSSIDRFDIVVVDIKTEKIIKRVIGMPGETVLCENGVIYINDKRIDEEYGKGTTPDFSRVTLGDDEYFVLGDNREYSFDSQDFGPVKDTQVKGTTRLVLFPFTKIGFVE